MPHDKNPTNKKFFNAVRALQSKDIDPEAVSKDVVKAARQTSRSVVNRSATPPREMGRHKEEPRVRLKSSERKVKEEGVSPANTDSLNLISTYSNYGKALRQAENLIEIGTHVNDIIDMAEQIVLAETNDWFDENTVKRNVKEMKAHSKDFLKTVTEAQRLMERAQALYDDMGVKLNRYFDIPESMDGHGVEDDASEIQHKKPKTFDVLNMHEENSVDVKGMAKKRYDDLLGVLADGKTKVIDGIKVDKYTAKKLIDITSSFTQEENREQFLSWTMPEMMTAVFRLGR